ncbi:unnamed protein product [Euphydryas editha]|uniref:Uncharacterized protein n=1 Tax=Euphydryas editha TaxID=104508 RepID=A0AAU9UIX8_EUPED|nr:unnamed protein product [Euphydryas editha]
MKLHIFALLVFMIQMVFCDHFEQKEEITVSGDIAIEYAANMGLIDKVLHVLKEFEEQTGKRDLPDNVDITVINKDAGDRVEYFCLRKSSLVKVEMNKNTSANITGYEEFNYNEEEVQIGQSRKTPPDFSKEIPSESVFDGNKFAAGQAKVNGVCADIDY